MHWRYNFKCFMAYGSKSKVRRPHMYAVKSTHHTHTTRWTRRYGSTTHYRLSSPLIQPKAVKYVHMHAKH